MHESAQQLSGMENKKEWVHPVNVGAWYFMIIYALNANKAEAASKSSASQVYFSFDFLPSYLPKEAEKVQYVITSVSWHTSLKHCSKHHLLPRAE